MSRAVVAAVGEALGSEAVESRSVGGGDINRALRVRLADGREAFVKHRPGAPAGTFTAEAAGLAWLAAADAVRVPRVLAAGDGDEARFLAVEWIERGRPAPDHDERLGRGLADLHRAGAPGFGLDADNWIGSLPQANAPAPTWAAFYAERRIAPLARRAVDEGVLGAADATRVGRLLARMDDLCGPPEPPARLHGDLWGGNAMTDAAGGPVLVDPAVYGGHREVDLAMMRLFGGFSARCFAAYAEAFPPAPGHEDRVGLCQLYPLLVHVLLFGGSYVASFRRTLAPYV